MFLLLSLTVWLLHLFWKSIVVASVELLFDLGYELDAVGIKADSQSSVMQLWRNHVVSAPF